MEIGDYYYGLRNHAFATRETAALADENKHRGHGAKPAPPLEGTRKQQQQIKSSSHNMATAVQASNRRVLGDIGNVVVGALSVRCNVNKERVQEWVRILRSFGYRNHKYLGQLPFHS
jgi:hypothetical protein